MTNRLMSIPSGTSESQVLAMVNRNFAELDNESVVKTFNGDNGKPAVTIGKLADGQYGLSFSDGDTTFLTITKDGIILNDGTNDRILIGKDEGGF